MSADRGREASNSNLSKSKPAVRADLQRPDLQRSSSVRPISGPTPLSQALGFWNRYANQILIGVIAVLVVIVLIRYRMASHGSSASDAADELTSARRRIDSLRQFADNMDGAPADQLAAMRKTEIDNAKSELDIAQMSGGSDPVTAAAVQVAYGDLWWTLANLPALPGAATQPALQLDQKPDDLLTAAQSAYQKVLALYPQQAVAVASARLGLAAIAENRSDWDGAAAAFQAIANDPQSPDAFKYAADQAQQQLQHLKESILVGTPSTAPAEAAQTESAVPGEPASPEAAFTPTTAPAIGVSVPATQP